MNRLRFGLVAISLALGFGQGAQAVCPDDGATPFFAGPIDPTDPADPNYNGFASYLQDSEGLALEICLDSVTGDGNPPFCFFDPPDPANPFSVQVGFGPEAFWWLAGADMDVNGGRAVLVMGAEAAWAAEIPVDGEQFPFTRLRIRVDLPQDGLYVVTHPYGRIEFEATAGRRSINESFDIEFLPNAFNQGRVGPWLTWDTFPGDPALSVDFDGDGVLEQYVGDGATLHAVKGSPCGTNFFRIEGPDIGGPGVDVVETAEFTVQGKVHPIAVPTPLTVDAVTYSRTPGTPGGDQVRLNVFATAPTTATVTCDICVGALATDGNGTFFTTLALNDVPASVFVTADNSAVNPLATPTTVEATPQDVVTITDAVYDRAAGTLSVSAVSSHQGATPPTLSVELDGSPLTGGTAEISALNVAPATVTVVSSAGGSDSEPVRIINPPPAP